MSPAKKVPIIVSTVIDFYELDNDLLIFRKKPFNKLAFEARYVAMLFMRRHTTYSIRWISEYFKHTNCSECINGVIFRERYEPAFKRKIAQIEEILNCKYEHLQSTDTGGFIPGR